MTKSHDGQPAELDFEAIKAELAGHDVQAEFDSVVEVLKLIDRQSAKDHSDQIADQRETQADALNTKATAERIIVSTEGTASGQEQRIGRFCILRQLGMGGYGLVYLAHDTELDRDVALKIPRPEAIITDELRARFLREGKAAALLSHPNIVPVFEAGHVGSVCFVVSQFVRGMTLADWCAQGKPTSPDHAAQLIGTLADAVQHAHSKGVIHRDLKPANILIEAEAEGESSTPAHPAFPHPSSLRITDFGLAKTISDGQSLTGTGAVIGTPSYMSPEQAIGGGHASDAATDIYSLGASLYELLTGRPPFVGDSVLQTLRCVQEEDPLPPRRMRPDLSRDLEAICLKCLEKQPSQRYPSAAALHADLTRYLGGEPVVARPVTISRRFQKWCRRNPAVATLSAMFVVSGMAAIISLASLWQRSEHHRGLAETKSAQLAHSIRSLFTILATSPEIRAPAAEPLRRRVIEQAEQVYASFVDKTPDDARLRFDQANSIYEVAKILDALGAVREALQKADEAIAIAGAVDTTSIVDGEHETMGNWLVFKGHLQTKLGDFAEANESFAEGLAHYKKLEAALPNETGGDSIQPYMASARADALAQQAMGEIQAKNVSAAIEFSEQCEEIWRRLAEHQSIGSQSDNIRFLMAHSFLILGQVYDVANDLPKSEQLLSEAIEIAESIDAFAVSAQVGARGILAACYHRYGVALARQERYDEARAAYDISLARFQQLVHDFPDVARYREFQSSARYSLAFTEYLCKNYELARDLVHANIASHQQLIIQFPETAGLYRDRIGDNYGVIAMMFAEDPRGSVPDRVQALEAARSAYDESLALRPDWKEPVVGWAKASIQLASILRNQHKDFQAAETHLVATIDRLESIGPGAGWHEAQATLAAAHHEFARLLDAQGKLDLAIGSSERGLMVLRHADTKDILLELAKLYAKAGRLDDAEQQIRGYLQDFATKPADQAAAHEVCLAIEEQLSEPTDQQRFRDLADGLR